MKRDQKVFYGWWIVAGCVAVTATIVPLVMSLSGKYALAVTADLRISRSQFMLANTIVQFVGILLSPVVSRHVAAGKMRLMQIVGIIGFCISYFTYSLATTAWHLYLTSVFLGFFFWSCSMIPISYMITMWFKEKRGLAMSIAMTGIGLGGMIFSQVVTLFLDNYGWRTTYQLMAGIAILCSLPAALFIFKSSPAEKGLVAYGEKAVTAGETAGTETVNNELSLSVKESYSKFFFWLLLLGMFLNGVINTGALGNFPAAIQELHDPTTSANIISIYSFVGIFGKLILGWINDRFGVVASSIFGCSAFLIAFVLLLFGENLTVLYLMAIAFGLGTPIGSVSPPLITAAVFGQKNYAQAYGLVNSVTTIGLALGSVFVAGILDVTSSYQIAWLCMIAFTALTLFGWVASYGASRKFLKKSPTVSEQLEATE